MDSCRSQAYDSIHLTHDDGITGSEGLFAQADFISLFFLQNVFEQEVYRSVKYSLTPEAVARIQNAQIPTKGLEPFFGKEFANARRFQKLLEKQKLLTDQDRKFMMDSAEIDNLEITAHKIDSLNTQIITEKPILSLRKLEGRVFKHRWQLEDALAEKSAYWRQKKNDKNYNDNLNRSVDYICKIFRSEGD